MTLRTRSGSAYTQTMGSLAVGLHAGISMEPTLHAMDVLEIMPYNDRPVLVGDVIFFRPPENDQFIVHRIIAVTSESIQTRGDNNCIADPFHLKSEHIVGQVVAAWQGQHRRRIWGGRRGRLVAELWRWLRPASRRGYALLRRYVKGEQAIRWLRTFARRLWDPRILVFQTSTGYSAKLLLGTRVIGHYSRSYQAWRIHQPFRLLIDRRTLPKPECKM